MSRRAELARLCLGRLWVIEIGQRVTIVCYWSFIINGSLEKMFGLAIVIKAKESRSDSVSARTEL